MEIQGGASIAIGKRPWAERVRSACRGCSLVCSCSIVLLLADRVLQVLAEPGARECGDAVERTGLFE